MARYRNDKFPTRPDAEQRLRSRIEPQKMADVMSELFAKRGYAQQQSIANYQSAWLSAVGATLGERTRAGNLKRGVLEVVVPNSAVLQELTFQKKQLLAKLAQEATDHSISDLRFRVGRID